MQTVSTNSVSGTSHSQTDCLNALSAQLRPFVEAQLRVCLQSRSDEELPLLELDPQFVEHHLSAITDECRDAWLVRLRQASLDTGELNLSDLDNAMLPQGLDEQDDELLLMAHFPITSGDLVTLLKAFKESLTDGASLPEVVVTLLNLEGLIISTKTAA